IYLWLTEKEKTRRFYLIYVTIGMWVVFFCPLVTYIGVRTIFSQETYYRILWMLPIYPVMAYTITKLVTSYKSKVKTGVIIVGCMILVVNGGVYTYAHPTFAKAENVYHIPQVIVDICDKIEEEGEWVNVAMPPEFLESVKQYSSNIRMVYGREHLISHWGFKEPLYLAMTAEVIDVEELTTLAKESACQYIVLAADRLLDGNLKDYGYAQMARVEHYTIYVDATTLE
ncbi:MAG: hypothetical protein R3Y54_02825, partial [Eubacteriales bacterium]